MFIVSIKQVGRGSPFGEALIIYLTLGIIPPSPLATLEGVALPLPPSMDRVTATSITSSSIPLSPPSVGAIAVVAAAAAGGGPNPCLQCCSDETTLARSISISLTRVVEFDSETTNNSSRLGALLLLGNDTEDDEEAVDDGAAAATFLGGGGVGIRDAS
jgi:hypothetical protein